jgi:hypothetical protein
VKKSPNLILLIGSLLGAFICLIIIANADLTDREALLVSVVLTFVSMLGSWVASRFYAEASFNENLRTFALKAAEKVDNLSNELDRLAAYLQQALEEKVYPSPHDEFVARELKIEGAIHIINTLKSVNDTSLSDWQGVIGKELDERREEQEERHDEIRELVERVEALSASQALESSENATAITGTIRNEINAIRSDLRLLTGQVGGVPIRRPKIARTPVELPCPRCSTVLRYDQKQKPNSVKSVRCNNCSVRLVSMMKDGKFVLEVREPKHEVVACPACTREVDIKLDPVPGTGMNTACSSCGTEIRATRSQAGITVRSVTPASIGIATQRPVLTESIISDVARLMPPQPWPKGAAKHVAQELNLPSRLVGEAIQELVRRGRFQMQMDGKLYVPLSSVDDRSNPN